MSESNIEELTAQAVAAQEKVDEAKATLKAAEDVLAGLEEELGAALAASGETQVKAAERYVTLSVTHRWSVPKESSDNLLAALKTHQPDLVKESVHSSTLNKFANEMNARDDAPSWWAEVKALLVEKTSQAVRITKSKPKK